MCTFLLQNDACWDTGLTHCGIWAAILLENLYCISKEEPSKICPAPFGIHMVRAQVPWLKIVYQDPMCIWSKQQTGHWANVNQTGSPLQGMTSSGVRMLIDVIPRHVNSCGYVPGWASDFSSWSHIYFPSSMDIGGQKYWLGKWKFLLGL